MLSLKLYFSTTLLISVICILDTATAARQKRQIIFEDDRGNGLYNSDCQTPDRRPGRCIRLRSCTALTQTTSNYGLRQYICGFEGDEPKVCCPEPMSDRTTARTTRRTTRTPSRVNEDPRTRRIPVIGSTPRPRSGGMTRPPFLPRSCGATRFTNVRVVGGRRAEKGSWPWMTVVYVRRSNGQMSPDCGGALVTNQHIVTAAHCVVTGRASRPIQADRIQVRLGGHDLNDNNEPEAVNVNVEEVRKHEQFEPRTYKNDIAVLKLSRPVTFTDNIAPVCLPYDSLRGDDLTSKTAYVVGYGTTAFNGNSSDVLMEASFDIQSDEICKGAYEPEIQFSRVYMCAGTMDGSKDACQGDSGGPLVTTGKDSNFYLVGVVSFGKQCGKPRYPGVYTRVSEFLDWLSRNLSD